MPLLPVLLAIHVTLAVGLFLPSILLPFALRRRRTRAGGTVLAPEAGSEGRYVRLLLRLQGGGSLVIGAGLAISGLGLVVVLGTRLLEQPWLLAALALYVLLMAIAFFIQRPGLRTLIGLGARSDEAAWRERARRGRYVSYAMAALAGTIGMLMGAKPELW